MTDMNRQGDYWGPQGCSARKYRDGSMYREYREYRELGLCIMGVMLMMLAGRYCWEIKHGVHPGCAPQQSRCRLRVLHDVRCNRVALWRTF